MQPPLWEIAGRRPGDAALDDGERAVDWGELDRRTTAIGRGMLALAGGPGAHVALVAGNHTAFLEVAIAAARAGFVYTPVKTGWTAEEMAPLLADAGTRLVVTDVPAAREAAAAAGAALVDLDAGFDAWVDAQGDEPLPAELGGWKMSFTSGTTGRPKGVVQGSPGGVPFAVSFPASAGFAEMTRLPGDGVHLFVSRLFHGAPLTFGLAALARGASIRVVRRWDAAETLALLRQDVTSTCMVPTMFRQLLALPEDDRRAFRAPRLATVLHGGEPCPQPLKQAMIDWLGPVLVEYYGFTEGGMTVATSQEWLERPGTVGRPIRNQRIIIRGEDGEELPAGEDGTVYFTAPEGQPGFQYLNDPDKTAKAYAGGAFTVGDVGRIDEDGYLYLSGRSADVIVSAGVNVYPAEIESALAGVPGVADLCVVGAPDEQRGEAVVARVVLAPGAAEDATLAALAGTADERLAGYKRPRRYAVVQDLPRDPTGKLLRHVVRREEWQGASGFAVGEHASGAGR